MPAIAGGAIVLPRTKFELVIINLCLRVPSRATSPPPPQNVFILGTPASRQLSRWTALDHPNSEAVGDPGLRAHPDLTLHGRTLLMPTVCRAIGTLRRN